MAAIEVADLTKTYRVYRKQEGLRASIVSLFRREYELVEAVSSVSFRIEQGEMVAFLGPNGAGKTTTLKLLAGLIFPTSGKATVLGHVPWNREIAYRRRDYASARKHLAIAAPILSRPDSEPYERDAVEKLTAALQQPH